MKSFLSKLAVHDYTILRLVMSFVVLWFGMNQVINPEAWIGFVPDWVMRFGIDKVSFVFLNGSFEIIFGSLLAFGIWTEIVSLFLFLHMVGIVVEVGITPIGVRDIGLAVGLLYLFLHSFKNRT